MIRIPLLLVFDRPPSSQGQRGPRMKKQRAFVALNPGRTINANDSSVQIRIYIYICYHTYIYIVSLIVFFLQVLAPSVAKHCK